MILRYAVIVKKQKPKIIFINHHGIGKKHHVKSVEQNYMEERD